MFTILLWGQVFAQIKHIAEIVNEPIIRTKIIFKIKKVKVKEKIYINRKPIVNYFTKKNCEAYRNIVAMYFPANQVSNALAIASQESGCNPAKPSTQINQHPLRKDCPVSRDCGFMQINVCGTTCPSNLLVLENNLRIARNKFNNGGWCPWFCPIGRQLCANQS